MFCWQTSYLETDREDWGGLLPHPSAVREETVIFFFLAGVALSPSQPRGDRLAHRRDAEKHFSFQLKKQFLFQVLFLFLNVKLFGFKWKKKREREKKIQKVFFFKQKKHTYKLPYQLASQGCQIHLAPKETQKKSKLKKKSKSKIYFYHCQSIFFMVSPPWVGLDVSL